MPTHRQQRGTFRTALFLAALCTSGAAQHLEAQSPDASQHQTPFERTIAPILANLPKGTSSAITPNILPTAQSYVTTPNFAGYQGTPYYAARTTASTIAAPTNDGVNSEVAGDFNKDGKLDIAVLQNNGTLNVLLNSGTGTFPTDVSYANPNFATSYMQGVSYAVDLNKDGYPDIVAFDANNATALVWMNLGNGTFNAVQTISIPTDNGYPVSIALGDTNGDGIPDLVAAEQAGTKLTMVTMLGTGKGGFSTPSGSLLKTSAIGISFTTAVNGVALGDLNGDGKLDVAVILQERPSSTSGNLVVSTALGAGDGSFGTLGTTSAVTAAVAPSGIRKTISFSTGGVQLVDVNKDGKLDVVVDSTSVLYVATGIGDGTFNKTPLTSTYATPAQESFLDVNGDGIVDAVNVGNGTGNLAVYAGKGDGTFAAPAPGQELAGDTAAALVTGDFDGDGKIDASTLSEHYFSIQVYLGTGNGFRGAPMISSTTDFAPLHYSVQNVLKSTNSGFSDMVLIYQGTSSNVITTAVADGKGNFSYVPSVPTGLPSTWSYVEPISVDFNGDGLQDLVVATTGGGIYVALAKGDGTFAAPVSIKMPTLSCVAEYGTAADLNGDGKMDLIIPYPGDSHCSASSANPSGYYVALGKGDGTFATPVPHAIGSSLYSITAADMNGDGKQDIILNDVTTTAPTITLLPGNGDGTFADGLTLFSNYVVSSVSAGDINGDGKQDLLLTSEETVGNTVATGGLIVVPGNGDGTFRAPTMLGQGNFFYGAQLADVNNDGNLDIITALYSTTAEASAPWYGLSTVLGNGDGTFAAPVNQLIPIATSAVFTGHFLNDGATDVASYNAYGTSVFFGQGGSTISLKTSAASSAFGANETLTATVAPYLTGRPNASGAVTFYDGTTVLGTGNLSAGVATFTTSSLAVGSHTIKAVYAGDTNYNPASSATSAVTITTLAPAFTLAGGSSTVSIQSGAQGLVTLNLAANATFAGAVNFTCTGAPANATCAVNPGSVTLAANGTGTATLVIGTTGLHTAAVSAPHSNGMTEAAMAFGTLGVLLFMRRRNARKLSALALGVLMTTGVLMTGCSDGGPTAPTTGPTTFTVQVTATPASGNGTAQTTSVSVTVN